MLLMLLLLLLLLLQKERKSKQAKGQGGWSGGEEKGKGRDRQGRYKKNEEAKREKVGQMVSFYGKCAQVGDRSVAVYNFKSDCVAD
ncbi:MAG: hypothetical protein J3R72DRAFT_84390 [Linnemannia gamsii]|nr:MAG: hypothetical protein J3R72DRAFT_84390 [Linnemannia gamsii]